METLKKIITDIAAISESSAQKLCDLFEEVHYPKSHLLFRQHEMDPTLYVIKSGIARAYYRTTTVMLRFGLGRKVALWFPTIVTSIRLPDMKALNCWKIRSCIVWNTGTLVLYMRPILKSPTGGEN
jgi:hypothetical protein